MKRSVTLVGDQIEIRFPYHRELVGSVKLLPFRRWDPERKIWTLPAREIDAARSFAASWGFELSPELVPESKPFELPPSPPLDVPGMVGELRAFQRIGVRFLLDRQRALLAFEMGLGKTLTALAGLAVADAFPALVVCPASLKRNWRAEAERFFPDLLAEVLDGRSAQPSALPEISITNFATLPALVASLCQIPWRAVIFDESHFLKSGDAKRTRAAIHLMQSVRPRHRWLLSGTPSPNRPCEFVSQLEVLDRIREFGGSEEFEDRYCQRRLRELPRGRGRYWDCRGAAHLDELHAKLEASCMLRFTREQVLPELPEKERVVVPVDYDRRAYAKAEAAFEDWQTKNPDPEWEALMGQLAKLRSALGLAKLPAAIRFVKDLLQGGEKVVLFAWHQAVVDGLAEAFKAPKIRGGISLQERQRIVEAFQRGEHPVLVGNLQAAGVGITLTAAARVVIAELPWVPADLAQAEDRVARIGQRRAVVSWVLVAPGTIDEKVWEAISRKTAVTAAVADGLCAGTRRSAA